MLVSSGTLCWPYFQYRSFVENDALHCCCCIRYGAEQIPHEWRVTCEGTKEALRVADRVFEEVYLDNPTLAESIARSISTPVKATAE